MKGEAELRQERRTGLIIVAVLVALSVFAVVMLCAPRDNANDSRFRGFISEDQMPGRMFYVLHVGRCDE